MLLEYIVKVVEVLPHLSWGALVLEIRRAEVPEKCAWLWGVALEPH
jgi:hypothetical protein